MGLKIRTLRDTVGKLARGKSGQTPGSLHSEAIFAFKQAVLAIPRAECTFWVVLQPTNGPLCSGWPRNP